MQHLFFRQRERVISMRQIMHRAVLTTILGFSVSPASAQFRASIQGTVTDPQGEVIPNAKLSLTDKETSRILNATSNGSGVYNFNALAPDSYILTAEAKGFQKQVIDNVHITPEQANAVNVQLSLGGTDTTVNVSGDTLPALETATASISGTITSNDIHFAISCQFVYLVSLLSREEDIVVIING